MQAADAVSQSIVAFVTTIQSAIEKALNWLAPDNSTPANNALVGTSFDLVNWMLVGTVDKSSPRTFNAGTTIGLLASSNAGPLPTNQFSFLVKALQSDENANLIPSMTENGDPSKSYSSGFTGLASGNQFVIEAQPPNATSNWQWSVSLPIAGPTHDNALNNTVTIYVPRGSQ